MRSYIISFKRLRVVDDSLESFGLLKNCGKTESVDKGEVVVGLIGGWLREKGYNETACQLEVN